MSVFYHLFYHCLFGNTDRSNKHRRSIAANLIIVNITLECLVPLVAPVGPLTT